MKAKLQNIQNIYLVLTLLSTLAASLIWGINTLFLLDAGLSNTEAFAANAFFTAGMMVCEVPTGIIADMWGRRTSYLLGTVTLALSTMLYLLMWQLNVPFIGWAAASVLLGLGFTFFSGATEAWLVDALKFTGYKGSLESVFVKGQIVTGAATLIGSVTGGVVAQSANLGTPYILRAVILGLTAVFALLYMKDLGFTPAKSKHVIKDMNTIFRDSIKHGLGNPPVRWIMLAAPFSGGVGIYAFYAAQPYLLELYGNPEAYGIAGLTAAIVAGAQIIGGLTVKYIRRLFGRRTSFLFAGVLTGGTALILTGVLESFWLAVGLIMVWGLVFAATAPILQAYLNGLIPSSQRATVLSFNSLMSSSGGVAIQPVLGRAADVWSYSMSFILAGVIQMFALPFILLARREHPVSDL